MAAERESASEVSKDVDTFLIAEYEHFADSFWKTEELGEKRLNFFISLSTAAVAGLVALATADTGFSDEQVKWLSVSVGIALVLLGVSTYLRMLRRNNVADQYKRAINHVRQHFVRQYKLEGYDPMGMLRREPTEILPRKLFTGGLAQTAALLNSIIAGGITAMALLFVVAPGWIAGSAAAVFLLSITAQFAYIRHRHEQG